MSIGIWIGVKRAWSGGRRARTGVGPRVLRTVWLCVPLSLAGAETLRSEDLATSWRFDQSLTVAEPNLLRVALPAETLGAARAELEDLRLVDPAGREVPYMIERAEPPRRVEQPARSFAATLAREATVLTIETGLAVPIESVELLTPATDLIKAVTVEGSADRATWTLLVRDVPVFRQTGALSQLRVPLSNGSFPWLRVTVDDRRSAPVPFTGATLRAMPADARLERAPAVLRERTETPGETRLRLGLPAAHLPLATLSLDVSDPVFSRQVTVLARQVIEGVVRDTKLAQDRIYRLDFEAVGAVSNQVLRVERPVPASEMILAIDNQDSPPLTIAGVQMQWRPVDLVFRAAEAGTYRLLLGNPVCAAPRYDVAALRANLRALPLTAIRPSAVRTNPLYRPSPTLPTVADTAAPLDPTAWKYRSPLLLTRPGAQQLELTLPVLAHAQQGLADLRLLRQTNQVPFVLEPGFTRRTLTPMTQAVPDPKRPRVSRWQIRLPQAPLPLIGLTCTSPTPLFDRTLTLGEERMDERGDRHRVTLGSATWRQTPQQVAQTLRLEFSVRPETDTLWLETDNGDNPPLQLDRFEVSHAASRILFNSDQTDGLYLYYGHPSVVPARYDLSLVADQLLAADKAIATLGPEERLHGLTWQEQFGAGGRGGPLIWLVLIGVVAALLLMVRRLLPHAD